MSAKALAAYIKERLEALGMSISVAAEKSGLSRQTWHKLIHANIIEAKLSTLIQVAETLETHPLSMMRIYFQGKPSAEIESLIAPSEPFACRFIADVTYPDNSTVYTGEVFEKVWEVANVGPEPWLDWQLRCVDEHFRQSVHFTLKPLTTSIAIPPTPSGGHARLSVQFRAPDQPCTAISHWKSFNAKGEIMFPKLTGLYCMVKVIQAHSRTDDLQGD